MSVFDEHFTPRFALDEGERLMKLALERIKRTFVIALTGLSESWSTRMG